MIYYLVIALDNLSMDIQEIRRARLALLIKEKFNESQAEFVSATGENQGEISGLLKKKSFGEKKARKLEAKAGLTSGWLDTPLDAPSDSQPGKVEGQASSELRPPEWMAPEAFRILTLIYSAPQDRRAQTETLLSLYYTADKDGAAEILNTARDFGEAVTGAIVHNKA